MKLGPEKGRERAETHRLLEHSWPLAAEGARTENRFRRSEVRLGFARYVEEQNKGMEGTAGAKNPSIYRAFWFKSSFFFLNFLRQLLQIMKSIQLLSPSSQPFLRLNSVVKIFFYL